MCLQLILILLKCNIPAEVSDHERTLESDPDLLGPHSWVITHPWAVWHESWSGRAPLYPLLPPRRGNSHWANHTTRCWRIKPKLQESRNLDQLKSSTCMETRMSTTFLSPPLGGVSIPNCLWLDSYLICGIEKCFLMFLTVDISMYGTL